jgi:Immunity protein 42
MTAKIFGDPSIFAIESEINIPFEKLSQRALGYFVLYVEGNCYGNRSPDASMLACSFDAVDRRIANRGKHSLPFNLGSDPYRIADAVHAALYVEDRQDELFFGQSAQAFRDAMALSDVVWAPDGDAAFDDGSHVLQFDEGDEVRLIAFKNSDAPLELQGTVTKVCMNADRFYGLLETWQRGFEEERLSGLTSAQSSN